jgi:HAE1 family hydrophobic/amphiphilic exporter-1
MSDDGEFRLSAWGIRNPIPVTVLFIALVLMGVFAYFKLPIKNFPNVQFPGVAVTVTRSGAAPAEMESQITRIIENSLAGLPNVQSIASTITQGSSTTVVQFYLGTDLQKALDDVRTRTDQARAQLPRDIDPPLVQRLEMDDQPIMTYAVAAPGMSTQELSWFIEDTLARTLQAVPGVAQVSRVGGVDREINVIVDPDRLAAHGLTADNVSQALAVANRRCAFSARQPPSSRYVRSPFPPVAGVRCGFRMSRMSVTAPQRCAPSRCSTVNPSLDSRSARSRTPARSPPRTVFRQPSISC